jgi:hypothetical protein
LSLLAAVITLSKAAVIETGRVFPLLPLINLLTFFRWKGILTLLAPWYETRKIGQK